MVCFGLCVSGGKTLQKELMVTNFLSHRRLSRAQDSNKWHVSPVNRSISYMYISKINQPNGLTYADALNICKSHGAIMAEPSSKYENEYLKRMIDGKGDDFWIGKFVASVALWIYR